ncbi:MAG TPA: tetratricopeptide repeat protein [Candidatus Rubrimentiphilum sp.]|nr:tetratricopeptide repeat protein [Candidatus Rubrimentiphilum sp.]
MKRFLLLASFAAALGSALAFSGAPAHAARAAAATATPSPTPAPLPTASPEPPQIAIPRLQARLKTNPNDRDAMIELASQFLGLGSPQAAQAAVQLTQHVMQLGTKTAQVYFLDGSGQLALGNLGAATADFEAASNLEPTNLAVLGQLAQLYLQAKPPRSADAERIASRAVTFNKTEPRAYVTLGMVLAAEQKWDDARKQFEQAYVLDTKDISPLIQEAQTWVAQNTLPNALTAIDRAISLDPKNVRALVFRAGVLAKENNIAASAQAFDDAVAASTNDYEKATIIVQKALMYAAAKQPAQAQAVYDAAFKQYPAVSTLHTAYGEYWMANRQPGRAEQQFLQAVRIDKNDTSALIDLAQLKMGQGKPADAARYLKMLSDAAPSGQTFALLGQAYVSSHQYPLARAACAQSFQMARNPDTLACIAGSDYSMKNYKEAAQLFTILDTQLRGYIDQHPDYLYMMGVSYTSTKQPAKACTSYKRLLKLMKKSTAQYKQIAASAAKVCVPAAKKKH